MLYCSWLRIQTTVIFCYLWLSINLYFRLIFELNKHHIYYVCHNISHHSSWLLIHIIIMPLVGESEQLRWRLVWAIHPCQTHCFIKHWRMAHQRSVQVRQVPSKPHTILISSLQFFHPLLYVLICVLIHRKLLAVLTFLLGAPSILLLYHVVFRLVLLCTPYNNHTVCNTNINPCKHHCYTVLHRREYLDPVTGQTQQYCTLTGENPVCILDPYPTSNILQIKRATARRVGSTYAPDFLGLMEVALINSWQVQHITSHLKGLLCLISCTSDVLLCTERLLYHQLHSVARIMHVLQIIIDTSPTFALTSMGCLTLPYLTI